MEVNYLGIFAAAAGAWFLGAIYYNVLGKVWLAASGKTEADMTGAGGKRKMPLVPMVISLIALLVMAAVFSGLLGHLGYQSVRQGAISGALLWVGFVITTQVVNNAYQMRKTMLTVIDGGYWLIVLVVQGAILVAT